MDNQNFNSNLAVAPLQNEVRDSYLSFIEEIKHEIEKQRFRVVLNANSEMIILYWNIGQAIFEETRRKWMGSKSNRTHV